MRLLVLGATGGTGGEMVRQALEAGHDVTVLVREPGRLRADQVDRVMVRRGSVMHSPTVDGAVEGHDAVLCALGVNSPTGLVRPRLMQSAMVAVARAMERHQVGRLILLSALGVGGSRASASLPLRLTFATLLRGVGSDKAAGEDVIRHSDTDWTVVYAPVLTTGRRTGSLRAREAGEVRGLPKVCRADVAEFMLGQVTDGAFVRKNAIVVP